MQHGSPILLQPITTGIKEIWTGLEREEKKRERERR